MKQMLIELDDDTAARLERAAPARSRRRSAFIRAAVRRALDAIEEARMAAAYRSKPVDEPQYFDAMLWEHDRPRRKR